MSVRMRRVVLYYSTCVFLTVASQAHCASDVTCTSQELLQEYRQYREYLINISPNGRDVLAWAKYDKGDKREGLVVRDAISDNVRFSMRAPDPVTRVKWRPDGLAISYFIQERGTTRRRFFLWDLNSDKHREYPIPVTYAQRFVGWSPSGGQFAFTSDQGGIVIVNMKSGDAATYLPETRVLSFDWSPDSNSVAAIITVGNATQLVTITDTLGVAAIDEAPVKPKGYFREVAWQGAETMILLTSNENTGADASMPRFTVTSLVPNAWRETILLQTSEDVRDVAWLPDGRGFLWHERKSDGAQAIHIRSSERELPIIQVQDGAMNFRGFLADGKQMVVSQLSPGVDRLLGVPLDGLHPTTVLKERRPLKDRDIIYETVDIRSFDGAHFPLPVARISGSEHNANAIVIHMHGGLPNVSGSWVETQLYLNHGVGTLRVGNRRPHGAMDLLAACDYARDVLKVSSDRIVLLGSSNAASIVLEAALRQMESMGIVVMISLTEAPPISIDAVHDSRKHPKILLFHGGQDRSSTASAARQIVGDMLGSEALQPPQGMWHVFDGEGHILMKDESLASVHATVLKELGLIECDE